MDFVAETEWGLRVSARWWGSFPVVLSALDDGTPALAEQWEQEPQKRWERDGMFEGFLSLARQDDRAIVRFANRYGVLGLCEHGVPSVMDCARVSIGHVEAERLDHWRAWSRRLSAAIEVGQKVFAGLEPDAAAVDRMLSGREASPDGPIGHWSSLDKHFDANTVARSLKGQAGLKGPLSRNHQAFWFCRFFNAWLGSRAVVMPIREPQRRLQIEYGPTGLFSALMLNTALAITGITSFVVCSNCGQPFAAERRRAPHRRVYCARYKCRVRAAQRDASREYRRNAKKKSSG